MAKLKTISRVKIYTSCVLFGLLIGLFLAITISFQSLHYDTLLEYDAAGLMENLKPELLDGVTLIFYINRTFKTFPNLFTNYINLGVYVPFIKIIKLDVNERDYNPTRRLKSIFCHELGHHHWYYQLPDEVKDVWRERYVVLEKTHGEEYMINKYYPGNVEELYAVWWEENWQENCYN